jgi:hypothetical protein
MNMRTYSRTARTIALLLLLAFVASPGRLAAQVGSGNIPGTPEEARAARLQTYIRYLAGDELAGRRTGSEGNGKAARFIAGKFREFGLQSSAGADGYYYMFDHVSGIDVGKNNSFSFDLGSSRFKAASGADFNPLGFSDPGSVTGGLVFAGYGIVAKDLNYDDYAGIDAKGKIVIVMRYSPDGANPHGQFAPHAALAQKVSVAREHGAAGLVVINQPLDSASVMKTLLDRNFTNSGLPAISVRSTFFDAVHDRSGRTLAKVQAAIDLDRKPASFEVRDGKGAMTVDISLKRDRVPDVIGVLPGRDPKLRDEMIVIGGHFDHLGLGGEGSLYSGHEPAIHHGADDNASGPAGVIELADLLAHTGGNRRTIIFMTFNGEEEGLLGSAAFVEHPLFPLEKVAAMINMDMIGRLDSSSLIVQGTGTSPWWKEMLPKINNNRFTLKMVEDGYGPSDHSSFYGKNVPVLFFFTGLHNDYHRPSDTWDKINYPGEARVLDYVADMVRAIDARDDRPPFTKTKNSTTGTGMGFKVYVGTIPDYAFDGKGLRLSGVADGGPAQKGGLQGGDIIVRMNTKQINNIYDYTYALSEFTPKQRVEVEFLRNGESKTTTVEMGSR